LNTTGLDHLERKDRSHLPELAFSINPGDDGLLEDPGKDGKVRNLKTQPLFGFTKKKKNLSTDMLP
jgi:hypothetical protein